MARGQAPIRNGLGAGGQRPAEKRGFFDFATRSVRPDNSAEDSSDLVLHETTVQSHTMLVLAAFTAKWINGRMVTSLKEAGPGL